MCKPQIMAPAGSGLLLGIVSRIHSLSALSRFTKFLTLDFVSNAGYKIIFKTCSAMQLGLGAGGPHGPGTPDPRHAREQWGNLVAGSGTSLAHPLHTPCTLPSR